MQPVSKRIEQAVGMSAQLPTTPRPGAQSGKRHSIESSGVVRLNFTFERPQSGAGSLPFALQVAQCGSQPKLSQNALCRGQNVDRAVGQHVFGLRAVGLHMGRSGMRA